MVRYAVVSDIHANLEAFEVVLEDIAGWSADRILCLGDAIGYGPDPQPCLDRLLEVVSRDATGQPLVVRGNHEDAIARQDTTGFQDWAATAAHWTRRQLSGDHLAEIDRWPYLLQTDNLLLTHGSPTRPEEFPYIVSEFDILRAFDAFEEHICFIGHSHKPFVAMDIMPHLLTDRREFGPLEISSERRFIVNAGSVGQPRDSDPRAGYIRYDSQAQTVQLCRLDYPNQETSRKIRAASLPPLLADRLSLGW